MLPFSDTGSVRWSHRNRQAYNMQTNLNPFPTKADPMDEAHRRTPSHGQPHAFHPDTPQQPTPVLPRKRAIFQTDTSAGSYAIYKLLAKSPRSPDENTSNPSTDVPPRADHLAASEMDEDPLVVLKELIANNGQSGTECQLDNRQQDALRTVVARCCQSFTSAVSGKERHGPLGYGSCSGKTQ
jgi:hypothetical protein